MSDIMARPDGGIDQAVNMDHMARFIEYLDAKPQTIATYTRSLRQFMQYLADKNVTSPSRADVIGYREQLKATGHKPATVQLYIVAVRRFLGWTETEGIHPNTARGVKGAKLEKAFRKDPLTSRQVKTVMHELDRDSLTGARDYAILAVMITGGLRTIEVIRADIDDLRTLGDNTVLYIQGKGKDDKSDFIKITPQAEAAIRDYMKLRGKASGADPLFAAASRNNKGGRMTTRSVSRIVKDHLIACGLNSDRLTAHSLRHTAATLNLLNGGSLEETQQLLRHAKLDTTMIYSHHIDRLRNQSEARIADAIF